MHAQQPTVDENRNLNELLQLLAFEDSGVDLDSLKAYAAVGVSKANAVGHRSCRRSFGY